MLEDGMDEELIRSVHAVANAICPPVTKETIRHDAYGNAVGSLTEAIMGVTQGLEGIANAILTLCDKIENHFEE